MIKNILALFQIQWYIIKIADIIRVYLLQEVFFIFDIQRYYSFSEMFLNNHYCLNYVITKQ